MLYYIFIYMFFVDKIIGMCWGCGGILLKKRKKKEGFHCVRWASLVWGKLPSFVVCDFVMLLVLEFR